MIPIALRPARESDREFLFALLRDALGPHIVRAFGAWREAEQRERFFASLKLALHQIVELAGEPVGCLSVTRSAEQLKLNRVFLLPSHQGRGIGSQLIRTLAADADASGVPVRLRVFKLNPARRLYERLGFRITGEIETHFLMERAPRSAGAHLERSAR